jgi:hypothetical protein
MDYDTDDDRMTTAEQLAGHDPRAGAEFFRAIACDHTVDDGLRLEAAGQLPELDPRAAAEALRAIAGDHTVDDGLRSEAAGQLARLDPQAAAETFRGIHDDRPRRRACVRKSPGTATAATAARTVPTAATKTVVVSLTICAPHG